mgnify:CR=1 FL=1
MCINFLSMYMSHSRLSLISADYSPKNRLSLEQVKLSIVPSCSSAAGKNLRNLVDIWYEDSLSYGLSEYQAASVAFKKLILYTM